MGMLDGFFGTYPSMGLSSFRPGSLLDYLDDQRAGRALPSYPPPLRLSADDLGVTPPQQMPQAQGQPVDFSPNQKASGIPGALQPYLTPIGRQDNLPKQTQVSPPLDITPPAAPNIQFEQPSLFQRAGEGIANNPATLMALGAGIMQGGFSKGLQGAMAGAQMDAQTRNQAVSTKAIYDGLVSKGYNPQQALAIASAASRNKEIAQAILPEALGTRKPSGTMKIGNLDVPYIIGDKGQAQLVLPGGGGISSLDDLVRYGQDVERGMTAAKTTGESQGKVLASLPNTTQSMDDMLNLIETARSHPGRSAWSTGVMGVLPGIPGTQGRDFAAVVDQMKGKAFLQAFETLKGGGQITEAEGRKATDAIARLDRAQTKDGFDQALDDLKSVVVAARTRLGPLAGVAPTPPAYVPPRSTSNTRFRFNPATGQLE